MNNDKEKNINKNNKRLKYDENMNKIKTNEKKNTSKEIMKKNAELLFILKKFKLNDVINIHNNKKEIKFILKLIKREELFKECIDEINNI